MPEQLSAAAFHVAAVPVLSTTIIEAAPIKELRPEDPNNQFIQAIYTDPKALPCDWESYQRLQDATLYASLVQAYPCGPYFCNSCRFL